MVGDLSLDLEGMLLGMHATEALGIYAYLV